MTGMIKNIERATGVRIKVVQSGLDLTVTPLGADDREVYRIYGGYDEEGGALYESYTVDGVQIDLNEEDAVGGSGGREIRLSLTSEDVQGDLARAARELS